MSYWNNGKKGENDFVKLVKQYGGATLVHDTKLQYQDIDCKMKSDGRTVSVKDQYSADKFECFLFEYSQQRTSDGKSIQGNLQNCQADLYAICSPTKWFVFDAPKLKEFILSGTWKKLRTNSNTEKQNRQLKGENSYDRAWSYVISYKDLRESGALKWETKRI